jgi:ankyrin repeat protein
MKNIIISIMIFMLFSLSGCDYGSVNLSTKKNIATDLSRAIRQGDMSKVKDIIENKKFDVNEIIEERYQQTPIYVAAYYGRKDIIIYFLKQGADINAESLAGPSTPLLISIRKNNEDLAIFLLNNGASHTISNPSGVSPCEMAKRQKMARLIKLIPDCSR